MTNDFVHLHVHSQYSLLDGQASIKGMVNKAIGDGMRGMALTDHGNMFGVKELYDYCKQVNKDRKKQGLEPFKPIFGCEMYVARGGDKNVHEGGKEFQSGWHLIVLAKNLTGYHNLIKLVSRSWVDGFYMRPRTDHKDLEKFHEGLIICSACIGGEVPKKIAKGDMAGAEETVKWFHDIWGDDYYLELQRHEVTNPNQIANRDTYEVQKRVNPVLIELARKYGVKLVCSNDSHFLDEDDAEAHDLLLCLSTGKDLEDPNRMRYSKQEWFKTRAEMNAIFGDLPEALANTCEILDKVEFYDLESNPIMPFFPIPEEFGTEELWRQRFTEEDLFREFTSDENGENTLPREDGEKKIEKLGGIDKLYRIKFEADYLAKLAYEGAARLYPTPLSKEVDERIRFELHIMKTMGFPGYFLIVQDFINSARNELGVWVGPGRGSAAGSVVAYCLGITRLDPLKYDLLFERFLNPDRISLPDIDTDFDDDGRGKVLQWVMDKYGVENCAHIITYGAMAAKSSLKDVGRVEKVPLSTVNAWCKAMPDRLPDGKKPTLENYINATPELKEARFSRDKKESDTIKYALKLEGTVRNTGIHACGFIICRDPISDHVPVSTADDPDFPDRKTAVTQYDGHVIESTGLIKMDFLGLKTLSQLKEACRIVKEAHGIDIDIDNIPIDDELTYKLYQEGRTVGTFQFESAGMRKYLKELHPTVFEDLIAMNALYRPGPMDYIPQFIKRKNGIEPITYDLDACEEYLRDTYGITVYQEQVMLLSRKLAGFTRGESDALRKAMGKKKKDIVDQMKPKFIEGGTRNGHDAKVLEKIWSDWEKFASYAFNKSHAACYSWVAYQTAYMKAHYPAEFMAALLTRGKDDVKEVTKLLEECHAMKLEVLGPDVNESHRDFGVNDRQQIRYGLMAIKGLGEAAVQAIVEEREKNGPYRDIFDFAERVNMSAVKRNGMECLALSGALDNIAGDIRREQFIASDPKGNVFLDLLLRYGSQYQQAQMEAQFSLFGMDAVELNKPAVPEAEEWSMLERLNKERSLVGIYLSAHPLDEYYVILQNVCNLKMSEMEYLTAFAGKSVRLGGIVTAVRSGTTKNGKPFGVATIEDFSGTGEIALFGENWVQWGAYLSMDRSVLITGSVEEHRFRPGEYELRIGRIDWLADISDKVVERITVTVNTNTLGKDDVEMLTSYVEENPGNTALQMVFVDATNPHNRLHMTSRSHKIKVTRQLLDDIDGCDALSYSINS
ncbi:MAG: DNA polymerase III subunit alpha [Bacteroidaceae bacterium]|nr:DNA polymerase III subunit alpha [Bacteroidaceae bacterium]